MGPLVSFLMECIMALSTLTAAYPDLFIDSNEHDFDNGTGYIEKTGTSTKAGFGFSAITFGPKHVFHAELCSYPFLEEASMV